MVDASVPTNVLLHNLGVLKEAVCNRLELLHVPLVANKVEHYKFLHLFLIFSVVASARIVNVVGAVG